LSQQVRLFIKVNFKMLTRGKIHNVSDGANCQDSEDKEEDDEEMNDENCSENDSSSSKERQSCKVPFRSHSALQMKRTPSADRANMSPVLVRKGFSIGLVVLFIIVHFFQTGQRSSRSTSRRSQFVTDISSEDTPLSKRQVMKSSGGKRKRLVLVEPEETSQEAEAKLNSTEESPDEDVNSRNQRKYSAAESETEKHDESHDGVRRSQRAKRQIYYNCNDSWIFAEKNVKVSLFVFTHFSHTLSSNKHLLLGVPCCNQRRRHNSRRK
jgi:hypothetical protein